DIADVRGQVPFMAEWILEAGGAITVELVGERANDCGAGGLGLFYGRVHVRNVDVQRDGRAAVMLWTVGFHFGRFARPAVADDEVGRYRVVALGNWLDCRHGENLLFWTYGGLAYSSGAGTGK